MEGREPTLEEVVDGCARRFANAVEAMDWDQAARQLHMARIVLRVVIGQMIDPDRQQAGGTR